jgi:hypothetical protein
MMEPKSIQDLSNQSDTLSKNRKDVREMNIVLKRISFVFGLGLLLISIHWSQDGFNFNVAGDSGGTTSAVAIGYFIASAATVLQFVFSTNLRNLNASLIVFGLIAYGYSIYTNYQGILHFQGSSPNQVMAGILGLAMDGVPEPLMAWALGESLSGDFIGNLFKGLGAFVTGKPLGGNGGDRSEKQQSQKHQQDTQPRHNNNHHQGQGKQKGSERRAELSAKYHGADRRGGGESMADLERHKMGENGGREV